MNILYILNDKFVPQVGAGICSLLENNRHVGKICFYIMSLDISEKNLSLMKSFISGYADDKHKREMVVIELDDMQSYFDFKINTVGWNSIILARLILDRLLPENVDRIIYLDGDTIVRRGLKKLYATDMGEKSIGAAMEPTCTRERKEKLGLSGRPYCNSGVLLLDMKNWRKNGTGDRLVRFYQEHAAEIVADDQDAINGTEGKNICLISPAYNYHNTYDIYRYGFYGRYCDFEFVSREEFRRIRRNPVIVHFLGEERPWRKGNSHRFGKEYLKYLKMTPWKDTPMEEGWQFYFFCWRIFNFVMKPFPVLRCKIISSLIPMFLRLRKK
ncbi:MAG: glycosyltransferase family 8 protein [Eubacterium sp.]|nr:glycosyltransferase family 8 protein [Eubacterium sp.]